MNEQAKTHPNLIEELSVLIERIQPGDKGLGQKEHIFQKGWFAGGN